MFKFGVFGVAFATVLSQAISAAGCGFVIFKNYRFVFPKKDDFKKSIHLWGKLFSSGVSLSMAFSVIHIGTVEIGGESAAWFFYKGSNTGGLKQNGCALVLEVQTVLIAAVKLPFIIIE